jgi:hypothetical protein
LTEIISLFSLNKVLQNLCIREGQGLNLPAADKEADVDHTSTLTAYPVRGEVKKKVV